jgi:hypothetical protein
MMADAQTGTTDPPSDIFGGVDIDKIVRGALPQTSVDAGKIKGELTAIGKQEAATKDPLADRNIARIEQDTAAAHQAKQGIDPVDLKPWDAEAEKKKYSTSPMEQFGSFGVIAATLASAFTRRPMVNALNGAAAAMTAFQEKKDKDYDRAYEAFKTNAELAIKRHNIQREAYQDAIQMLNTDREAGMSELTMLTEKFGDKRARALLDGGYIKELIDYQNSQRTAYEGMARLLPELELMNTKKQASDYLKQQGKNPADIYHEIYAPAYSSTLGNLKTQMIRDEMQKNGGDMDAAVRKVEATFSPNKVNLPANYAQEAIAGMEKDGIQLDPTTKALVASTLGKASSSAKAGEVNSAVAGAMEEIRRRKDVEGKVDTNTASQIIRDAISSTSGGQTKIDQAIVNQLPHYDGMTKKDLGYIGVKNQEKILSAVSSAENIEHIAEYVAQNPESVGLLADAERKINVDGYKALFLMPDGNIDFQKYLPKIAQDRDGAIDAAAKAKGLSQDAASKAKVLNKMLTTQAFADAAANGSRGATIYLDKAFKEIYQQASSLPAFFDVLSVRDRDSDMTLSKYNLDIGKRNDAKEKFPFFSDPEAFLTRAVTPRAKAGTAGSLPPKVGRVVGRTYQTPSGNMVWGDDGLWYSREEWQAKHANRP